MTCGSGHSGGFAVGLRGLEPDRRGEGGAFGGLAGGLAGGDFGRGFEHGGDGGSGGFSAQIDVNRRQWGGIQQAGMAGSSDMSDRLHPGQRAKLNVRQVPRVPQVLHGHHARRRRRDFH